MWMLGLSCNNLKNINNAVSLTTEHAICPFHLPGYIRKGKMHDIAAKSIAGEKSLADTLVRLGEKYSMFELTVPA